ncbi:MULTISPECIES: DUF1294 domain-containing protein [Sphingobacterium]|uniref:DUF1294 domain-containing protein n=1 Tax=Sphingobacterium TaxID=28453 RepID=UPI00104E025A|nr:MULTISPECIES: DUF1294 domain-containing protein [Sphingobacterium]MCW2261736.1 uncharacterized membrane protein YsdA (DUF1294 family) [Sphingobacterium kitahiroshimense]TCR10046.1 uncharacterized membrane protein YsdA (DUF1294 family) [Sphingobacterium sp. JUb78]
MQQTIIFYLVFVNLLTFLLFYLDKRKAVNKVDRISEKTLLSFCAIGGSLGGFLGMQLFRHKTKKRSFLLPFFIIVILQVGGVYGYANYHYVI